MSKRELDHLDRLILNALQSDFPVAARPYAVLAERLNAAHGLRLGEEEIFERVLAMRRDGFLRRLGAVFNARALGYHSTLCAAWVPEDKLEIFSELTAQAPQITHNYLRSGELNAWFTFTADQPEELEAFLARLRAEAGLENIYRLEAERVFKIKVDFQFQKPES